MAKRARSFDVILVGASAVIGADRFWAGNSRMLDHAGADLGSEAHALLASQPGTVVICGEGETPWALVRLHDPARPEARSVVAELRELGVAHTAILSGDHHSAVEAVREEVGIDEAQGTLLPEDKRAAVEELEKRYGRTAMVGDGVNDAEALVAASLGVGVGGAGADIAMESAQVVLMSPRLELLPDLIRTGRFCLRVIRQNVAIALGFKLLFLGLAAQNLATLWLAVAADMGATLVVIFNLYFSPRGEAKCVRGPSGRGARRLARAGVLEQYVEHGKQAQRSHGGRIVCFDRRVVRNAG